VPRNILVARSVPRVGPHRQPKPNVSGQGLVGGGEVSNVVAGDARRRRLLVVLDGDNLEVFPVACS
jgi:hypothetical protein